MRFDSLRTARSLGVLSKRMAPHLSPEALHELRSNIDLVGVLCGEMTIAKLALDGKARDDIKAVVKCLSLTCPQTLATLEDPQDPRQLLVLNKAEINLEIPQVRWGLYLQPETWTAETTKKAEQLNPKSSVHAQACLAASLQVGEPLKDAPPLPKQIGMIAYVDSEQGVRRLASVVGEWRENLKDYGHRQVQFRLCDDSPEPFSSQIRDLLGKQSDEVVQFEYLGPKEKAQLCQQLEQGLTPQLGQAEAARVAALMAGPGATQNRNLSMQLLGQQGGLQMDHDMTPEVLCSHWEDPIPFDILGDLRLKQNEYGLRSYSFTGAHDVSIEHILAADHAMAPRRISGGLDASMGNSLRGPMFVPSQVPLAGRIAPGLRDGDLALGRVSEKVTTFGPSGLAESIYHRDQAGGRWSGGQLVRQYLLFEFCDRAISDWVAEQDQGDPVKVGQALLRGLEQNEKWSGVGESSFLGRTQPVLKNYINGLPDEHPERSRSREQLCLNDAQEVDQGRLDDSLHAEARQVLRTQALALIHHEQIAQILGSGK
jgi:hypothetical protein